MKRVLAVLFLICLSSVIFASNTVTYPQDSGRPGRITVRAIEDLNDVSIGINPFYGVLNRIVINPTVTTEDTDFSVILTEDTGSIIFSKLDCNSVAMPYNYAITASDVSANLYYGLLISSGFTLAIQDVNYSPEIQTIAVTTNPFTPDTGYYTVSYQGQTTAHIPYGATTAVIDANCEALSTIGTGNVAAVASTKLSYGNPIVITATGNLIEQDLHAFTIDASNLTDTGSGERQTISTSTNPFAADAGYWTAIYNGSESAHIAYNANAAAVDAAIEAIIGSDDVTVTAASPLGYGHTVVVDFASHADVNALTVDANNLVDTGNAEVQTLSIETVGVVPDAGHYHIIYSGQTTSAIAWAANAATIQTAVQALSTVGSGNMTVTAANPLSDGNDIVLTFAGTLNRGDKNAVTFDSTTLTDTGNDELQTISQAATAASGHWHIAYDGNTTAAIAWDANATTVTTAMDTAFGSGEIVASTTVTDANLVDGTMLLTFSGIPKTDVALVTLTYTDLLDGESSPVEITATETTKGKTDVIPTVTITETTKGVADVTPTIVITETTKGVADVTGPTVTVTETQKGGNDLSLTIDIFYKQDIPAYQ